MYYHLPSFQIDTLIQFIYGETDHLYIKLEYKILQISKNYKMSYRYEYMYIAVIVLVLTLIVRVT